MAHENTGSQEAASRRACIRAGLREGIRRAVAERRARGQAVYVASNGAVRDVSSSKRSGRHAG